MKRNPNFSYIGGAGSITCQDCGYTQKVISALHDHTSNKGIYGFQCQSCGKITALEYLYNKNKETCKCGGKLSRDEDIFCPSCRSNTLIYKMHYIT